MDSDTVVAIDRYMAAICQNGQTGRPKWQIADGICPYLPLSAAIWQNGVGAQVDLAETACERLRQQTA